MKVEMLFKCSKCGETHIINKEDEVDLTTDKSLLKSILDDSFFTHQCSNCKEYSVIEYPFIVRDDKSSFLFKLNPNEERLYLLKDNDDREIRVVSSLNELKEKIRIKYFHLNDHIVEYIKKLIKDNLEENNDVTIEEIYFTKYEDEKLQFVLFDKDNYLGAMYYDKEGYVKYFNELKESIDKDLQIVNLKSITYLKG